MNIEIRVSEVRKCAWTHNKLSGHNWPEYGPVTGWEVRGPLGVWSKHKTEAAANKEAQALREYYDKYPINT